MCPLEEQFFSLGDAVFDGYFRELWEVFVANNKLMQLISKEVGAGRAAMTVVNGKETAPRPVLYLLEFGFDDVQDD